MAKSKSTFKRAVEATPDIANGFKTGLSALGVYSSKISIASTQLLEGSVDVDSCTMAKYPNASRWDYVFGYNGEAYFVEVHPANTGEVRVVLKKLRWLKDWLYQHAMELNNLKSKSRHPFYWIQSKGFAIPKTSPQFRAAESAGLKPITKLALP